MTAAAESDDILDSLWHGCALHAFLDQAEEERGWPSSEATKRRAYRYYEEALAERNRARAGAAATRSKEVAEG